MKNKTMKLFAALGTATILVLAYIWKEKLEEEAWWKNKKFIKPTEPYP